MFLSKYIATTFQPHTTYWNNDYCYIIKLLQLLDYIHNLIITYYYYYIIMIKVTEICLCTNTTPCYYYYPTLLLLSSSRYDQICYQKYLIMIHQTDEKQWFPIIKQNELEENEESNRKQPEKSPKIFKQCGGFALNGKKEKNRKKWMINIHV